MKIFNFIKLSFKNLKKRRLRMILNMLAIGIGTTLIMVMLGFGFGTQNYLIEEIKKYDMFNEISVVPFKKSDNVKIETSTGEIIEKRELNKKITKDDVRAFKNIKGVSAVRATVEVVFNEIRMNGKNLNFVTGLGYDRDFDLWFDNGKDKRIILGREISGKDSKEVLIGEKLFEIMKIKNYKELLDKEVELIVVNPNMPNLPLKEKVKIVGIINGKSIFSDVIVMPLDLAIKFKEYYLGDENYFEKYGYEAVYVRAESFREVKDIAKKIKDMGFTATTFQEALDDLNKYFRIFQGILGGFGAIVLFVAGLGVMNTMIMAVYERVKFIGLLRALGASQKDVRNLFLVESGCLGFLGGLLGVLIGSGFNYLLNLFINKALIKDSSKFVRIFSVSPSLILGVILFSVVLSCIAGFYPARRASKLDPVEALRYE